MIPYLHLFTFNTRLFRRIEAPLHILMLVLINGRMLPWSEEPPLTIISAARYPITAGADDNDSVMRRYCNIQQKEDGTLEKF